MEMKDQLQEWVKGNPIHNDETGECCPDFSCCNELLIAPMHERTRFYQAYEENDKRTMGMMLIVFLQRALDLIYESDEAPGTQQRKKRYIVLDDSDTYLQ